jgi:hypothetical protein
MTSVVSCPAKRLLKVAYALSSNLASDHAWISLFDEKNSDGWYTYLDSGSKNNDLHCVFKLDNGILQRRAIHSRGAKPFEDSKKP